jgi:hypothetical protein
MIFMKAEEDVPGWNGLKAKDDEASFCQQQSAICERE